MSKELSEALLELTKKTLELTKMNNALITYLIDKKKKAARKDVESKHAIKQLEKQTTATFWLQLVYVFFCDGLIRWH